MKKLFLGLLISVMLIASVTVVLAAKGGKDKCATIQSGEIYAKTGEQLTTGYDQFGYNYQAHMFNGRYCDYDRVPGGAYCDVNLIMKWSDEWLSNKDCNEDGKLDRGYSCDPINAGSSACQGAWETNHQFGSYEEGGETCYWNYFVKIVMVPEDAYRLWDVSGDWVLEFDYKGGKYIHDMTITDNTFTGTGGYPSGSDPYSITWTVDGTVDDNNVEMTISYDSSSYEVIAIGTIIASDGTMKGTWTSNTGQSGVWESTIGSASDMWYTADGLEIGSVIWGAYARILQIYNDPCAGETGVENKWEAPTGFGYYK